MIVNLLLTLALPVPWIAAGLYAGALPGAPTARLLRRRALYGLLGVELAGIGAFATAQWWLAGSPAAVAAIALPPGVALATAVPRLVRLRDQARPFAAAGAATPTPPALRATAAHPLVAGPLQATAYAATAGLLVERGALGPVTALAVAAVVSGITCVAHRGRYRRLRGLVVASRPPWPAVGGGERALPARVRSVTPVR